jgi:hypothetical protein
MNELQSTPYGGKRAAKDAAGRLGSFLKERRHFAEIIEARLISSARSGGPA